MLFVINLILGIGLLFAGRKLFWLFIAAAGFFVGVEIATRFFHGSEWLSIIAGVVTGILFALLAVALKPIAIGLAGFFLGGSILLSLATALGVERGIFVLYIIGGVLGILFISIFFDWALINISSLAGASMIARTLGINRSAAGVVFIILFFIGVVVQGREMQKEKKHEE